jgi:hypothetical protein
MKVIGKGRVRRRMAIGLAAALVAFGLIPPSPASADADGCTSGPELFSVNCIDVLGSGIVVWYTQSRYGAGVNVYSSLCNRYHRWWYTPDDGGARYRTVGPFGCIQGFLTSYANWYPQCGATVCWSDGLHAEPWTSFCAQSKNSRTNNTWTDFACIQIRP